MDFASSRISVEVSGTGPDVVLIPGLGSSPRIWDTTIRALPGYRYHVVHVAGFAGLTAGANASGPFLEPVAQEISRYISEASLERPGLVGHSLGGTWAMQVAARQPCSVASLLVVDIPPMLAPMLAGPDATVETVRAFAEQAKLQIATAKDEQSRRRVAEMVVGKARREEFRQASIAYWLASDPRVTSQGMYELFTIDLRPELKNVRVPMTVLWVTPDQAPLSEPQAREFYERSYASAPQVVLRHIKESHHLIMYDQPTVFQTELRVFLAQARLNKTEGCR